MVQFSKFTTQKIVFAPLSDTFLRLKLLLLLYLFINNLYWLYLVSENPFFSIIMYKVSDVNDYVNNKVQLFSTYIFNSVIHIQ